MKVLGLPGKVGLFLVLCAGLASADTLQLRNGRHLQGKYIGGTSAAIGFMSGASVEYFATTDVLVLMFDNGSDSSLGGNQPPSPMAGDASTMVPRGANASRVDSSGGPERINRTNTAVRLLIVPARSSISQRSKAPANRKSEQDRRSPVVREAVWSSPL